MIKKRIITEKKLNDNLVDAVNEYLTSLESEPNLDKRNQKIRQKFNKPNDDLTIKY
jgi:hypothetical protein